MRLAALSLLLVPALLAGGSAHATSSEDLSGLSDREYVDYAHDRFEWLIGEGRSGHHVAERFHRQCAQADKRGASADDKRACEIAKAADEQSASVLKEGQDLIDGLKKRFGEVPEWAREADANLARSVGK
jgi:hypothetical protein